MLDDLLEEWNAEHPQRAVPDAFVLPEVPLLKTPGLDLLLREGTEIDQSVLEKFLYGGKEVLRDDLLGLLRYATAQYGAYRRADAAHGLSRAQLTFPLHALLLRTALNMPGVLADVQFFLLRPADEIHFWMEDRLAHVLWLPFYKALPAEIGLVEDVVCAVDAALEVRLAAVTALGQSLLQDQFRLHLYVPAFERCLRRCAEAVKDPGGARVAGALVHEAVTARQRAVLPSIESAMSGGHVDTAVCGSYPAVAAAMDGPVNSWARMEAMDIFALYTFLERSEKVEHLDTQAGNAFLAVGRPKVAARQQQGRVLAPPKVKAAQTPKPPTGRNDLCPCGSGLKYKKCHGK